MKNERFVEKRKIYYTFMLIIVIVSYVTISGAQVLSNRINTSYRIETDINEFYDSKGKFKIEASFIGGSGLKQIKVGEAFNVDLKKVVDLEITGGEGMGGSLTIGYNISPSFELSITGGFQYSDFFSAVVEDAKANFGRAFYIASLKYNILVSSSGIIRVGGGIGYSIPEELDLDFSKVSGGGNNIYSYDGSMCFHITSQYEHFFGNVFSLGIGVTYINTAYNLNSFKSNGVNVPKISWPAEVLKLNGDGIYISLFMAVSL
jgi:hypothetical protein